MASFLPRRSQHRNGNTGVDQVRRNPEADTAQDTLLAQYRTRQRQQPNQMSYPDNTDSGNWDSAAQEDSDSESTGSAAPGATPNPYTPSWHADGSPGKNRH